MLAPIKKIVTIEVLESKNDDVVGYIHEIGDDFVTIKSIDTYGSYDGDTVIKLEDITHLICDSEQEATLDKLVRHDLVTQKEVFS